METVRLTSPELGRVIDQAGNAFKWSRPYQAVLGTAIGAAFTAAELDEATDTIGVAPPDVKELCDAIVASSLELGRAPRTATSYANAWRRLAGIAWRWKTAGGDNASADFWETVDDLRDKRVRRLPPVRNQAIIDSLITHVAPERFADTLESRNPTYFLAPSNFDSFQLANETASLRVPQTNAVTVDLSTGRASLVLPTEITDADVLLLVQAVLDHR